MARSGAKLMTVPGPTAAESSWLSVIVLPAMATIVVPGGMAVLPVTVMPMLTPGDAANFRLLLPAAAVPVVGCDGTAPGSLVVRTWRTAFSSASNGGGLPS